MIARLVAASVLILGVVMVPATPAQAAWCVDGALYSEANHMYVSAELGYTGALYGMLRARAATVGPWERFEFCYESQFSSNFSMRSLANGKWVAAELNDTTVWYGMLRARSSSVGPWEKFYGGYEIQSRANWKWVSAELAYVGSGYAMLRARANSVGTWENWTRR